MKNSKEIASAVFQARDEYIKRRKKIVKKVKMATAIGGTLCAFCLTIAGVGYWNSLQKKFPPINSDTDIITEISSDGNYGGDNDDYESMATAVVTTGSEGEKRPVVTTAVQSDIQTEPVLTQTTAVTHSSAVTQTSVATQGAVTTQTTAVTQGAVTTQTNTVTQGAVTTQTTAVTHTSVATKTTAVTQTSLATQTIPSQQTTTTVTFSPGVIPETITTTENPSGEIITTTTTEAESIKILDIKELKSRYGDSLVGTETTANIWPWEYKPIHHQYRYLDIDGVEYFVKSNAVSETLVSEKLGNYVLRGYDDEKVERTMEAEVYTLHNVTYKRYVAVKLAGEYYVYSVRKNTPTSTLGELLDEVDLPKLVELDKFHDNDESPYNHYSLLNDDYIWEVLSECRDAPYIDDTSWNYLRKGGVGFTITSESLGAYKLAMYITKDGYIWTNMLSHFRYVFYIGEEASAKIIEYAMENSEDAESEPYMNSIAGTIVEITDDYMVIDDSVICKNPEEGIQFTILLNDIQISRYVDCGVVHVGDFVKITFKGEIYSDYVIDSAISADIAYIDGDGYYVLE
ncbi:MAG: hypothetical protein E7500_05330 [Ruminococcus sp.]|nr:hypothetical protein [Ruminococcus sp.]